MSSKGPGVFQFNTPIEEVQGAEQPEVPAHIQNMEALSEGTKEALAEFEKINRPILEAKAQETTDQEPPVQEPLEDEPAVATEPPEEPPDEFDYSGFGQEVQDILNNDALRKSIEARCAPMNIDELLATGRCKQTVPVVPDEFEVTYQTVTGEEDLFVKNMLFNEKGSDLYISQKFSLLSLSLGLHSINGNALPPYEKGDSPDEELFKKRYEWVQKLPVPMLISLQVNYYWFDRRTRKLFRFRGDN